MNIIVRLAMCPNLGAQYILFHTVLDFVDEVYQRLRTHLRVRKTFFTDLQALTRYMFFPSWDQLLNFMYVQLELDQPSVRRRRKS